MTNLIGISVWKSDTHRGISGVLEDPRTGERKTVTLYSDAFNEAEHVAFSAALAVWPVLERAARRGE